MTGIFFRMTTIIKVWCAIFVCTAHSFRAWMGNLINTQCPNTNTNTHLGIFLYHSRAIWYKIISFQISFCVWLAHNNYQSWGWEFNSTPQPKSISREQKKVNFIKNINIKCGTQARVLSWRLSYGTDATWAWNNNKSLRHDCNSILYLYSTPRSNGWITDNFHNSAPRIHSLPPQGSSTHNN